MKEGVLERRSGIGRIRRTSQWLVWLAWGNMAVVCLLLPAVLILAWQDPERLQGMIQGALHTPVAPVQFAAFHWVATFALAAIPAGILLYALGCTAALFKGFSRGCVLTEETAANLRHIGLAIVLLQPAQIVVRTLASILLTANNAPGSRQVVVEVSAEHFTMLLVGLLLVVVGWAMGEAVRIADDHRQIV